MRLTVAKVLELQVLKDAVLLAGSKGLQREVQCVGVAETPDACYWVRKAEFVITACYSIRDDLAAQLRLVHALDKAGSAGIAVKFGRFIGSIPQEMTTLAEELSIPLISLPDALPFIDISHPIMLAILNEQADQLAYSERVYRSLTKISLESNRLDKLAAGLQELIGYDVSIYADYTQVNRLPLLSHKQVFGVKIKDAVYGYIVVATSKKLSKLEEIAISHAQTLAALQLMNRQLDHESTHNNKRDFLEELLNGRFTYQEIMESRANKVGFSIFGSKYLFMVDIDNFSEYLMQKRLSENTVGEIKRMLYRIVHDSLAMLIHKALIVQQSDRVIAVLPAHFAKNKEEKRRILENICEDIHTKVLEILKEMTVTITISKELGQITEIAECYRQLRQVSAMVKKVHGNSRNIFLEDAEIYLILDKIGMSMPTFGQDILGKLENSSIKQREELMHTLLVYLECQGNIVETANQLFIHRNTLHYRLKKIEAILGRDLNCPETRFLLWLALKYRLL